MARDLLELCGILACRDAGILELYWRSLVCETPSEGVTVEKWDAARKTFAAMLHANGWLVPDICAALGVDEAFVRLAYQELAERLEQSGQIER